MSRVPSAGSNDQRPGRVDDRTGAGHASTSTFRLLVGLLTMRERWTIAVLVVGMVLGGLLEVLGLGLVFPYIALLQNPGKLMAMPYLSPLLASMALITPRSLSIAISIGLLAVFCIKGVFALRLTSVQLRFIYSLQSRLGKEMLAEYLGRPYAFFLGANSSVLISNLTRSVGEFASGFLQGALSLCSEGIVLVSLVVFLIWLRPGFSSLALLFVVVLAGVFARFVKPRVARYGQESFASWNGMLRSANEGISSAKELQILCRERYFVDAYAAYSRRFVDAFSRQSLTSQLPRVTMETGAIVGMVLFSLIALLLGRLEQDLLAVLAVFAFATIRVVPSINRILQAWNTVTFNRPAIEVVAGALRRRGGRRDEDRMAANAASGPSYQFAEAITISIRSFVYPGNPKFRLADIEFAIAKGQTIAFIGHSGSGKTTLVDLMLGLFPEFDGSIKVDGRDIRDDVPAWRRTIGYIPQTLYLRDDTIARNVAFGVADAEIDLAQVMRAVRLAGLERVIQSQPQGLQTIIGDRGIRLSGGERQRIGIARALYHDPDVLIMDEATSALDNETEQEIVASIMGLSRAKTIIVIAHRLSTVRHCDTVYLMRAGCIVDGGTFDEIAGRNHGFVGVAAPAMAQLGS